MNFNNKRYTYWVDETFSGEFAIQTGLVYGVYDTKLNKKWYHPDNIPITSRKQAIEQAILLNTFEELQNEPNQ